MNKLFNFSEKHFQILCKLKLPVDCIFLLEMIKNEEDVSNEEYLPILQRLQRKGYIDVKGILTSYGNALYNSMWEDVTEEIIVTKRRIRVEGDKFEQWWDVYPATNDFEMNGKHFQGTQKKNTGKEEARKLFEAVTLSIPPDDVIKATEYHINMAKEISFKKKENQLTYIPNACRYLREKYFEPYISKFKNVVKTSFPKEFEI